MSEAPRQLVREHVVTIEPAAHAAAEVIAAAQVVDDVVADEQVDEHDVGRKRQRFVALEERVLLGADGADADGVDRAAERALGDGGEVELVRHDADGERVADGGDETALVLLGLVVVEAVRVDAEAHDRIAGAQLVGGEPALGVGRVLREQRRVRERGDDAQRQLEADEEHAHVHADEVGGVGGAPRRADGARKGRTRRASPTRRRR